jgi:hypothetical protein
MIIADAVGLSAFLARRSAQAMAVALVKLCNAVAGHHGNSATS